MFNNIVFVYLFIIQSTNVWGQSCAYVQNNINCRGRNLVSTRLSQVFHSPVVLDMAENEISKIHGNEFQFETEQFKFDEISSDVIIVMKLLPPVTPGATVQDGGWISLETIILSHNRIEEIDKLAFNGLTHLRSIDLSFNLIMTLPQRLFVRNLNLQKLDLSDNSLSSEINFIAEMLEELNISHCSLVSLPEELLLSARKLRHLNLSNNYMKKLSATNLKHLPLNTLNLEGNPISCHDEETQILIRWIEEYKIVGKPFCNTHAPMVLQPIKQLKYHDLAALPVPRRTSSNKPILTNDGSEHQSKQNYEDSKFLLLNLGLLILNLVVTCAVLAIIVTLAKSRKRKTGTSGNEARAETSAARHEDIPAIPPRMHLQAGLPGLRGTTANGTNSRQEEAPPPYASVVTSGR